MKRTLAVLAVLASGAFASTNMRIISFGPVITEELFCIGAGAEIVGVTTYCIHPDEAKKIERVGDLLTMSMEKVIRLRPDVVIATGLTHPDRVAALAKHGIVTAHFSQASTYAEMCDRLLSLGRITHHEREAREVVARSRTRLREISAANGKHAKKRVLMEIGVSPIFAVTTNSYINDMILSAGGINTAASLGIGMISREAAAALDPEVIIIADMGVSGADEVKRWKKHASLAAVKANAVHVIEPYGVCSTTVAAFPDAVASIAALIHGDK